MKRNCLTCPRIHECFTPEGIDKISEKGEYIGDCEAIYCDVYEADEFVRRMLGLLKSLHPDAYRTVVAAMEFSGVSYEHLVPECDIPPLYFWGDK